jgi:O-antigen/teichoic acid export membrane protein
MVLFGAATLAYGLDYLFNLAAGRMLDPAGFGVVVGLGAVAQIMTVASRVVLAIVTRYVSGFQATSDATGREVSFFRAAMRVGASLGGVAMILLVLLAKPLSQFWRMPSSAPVLALAAAAFMMGIRPVMEGVLQGARRFAAAGMVQLCQAILRLSLGVVLIAAGLGAFGAMLALPVSTSAAFLFGLVLLGRPFVRPGAVEHGVAVADAFQYSTVTALGLIGFALLINMDALLVKRFFGPAEAGYYGAAVTLGKVIQFLPIAITQVLFAEAARRRAAQQDPMRVLLPVMLIVAVLCGLIALAFALFPTTIVSVVFGADYRLEGKVLATLGLAMTLFALVSVWLHYYLSTDRVGYVYLVLVGVAVQVLLMILFHDALWHLPAIMSANALWLVLAGGVMLSRGGQVQRVVP